MFIQRNNPGESVNQWGKATLGLVLVAGVSVSACSGNTEVAPATVTVTATPSTADSASPSPSPSASPSPTIDTQRTLANYFEAFATGDPADMRAMRQNAQKGSPADLYAIHQIAAANAAGGFDQDEVTIGDGEVTMTSGSAAAGNRNTNVYQDFQFDPEGRLITWSVKDSGPLADRIQPLEGSITSNGVKFQLLTAYETNAGDLAVTAKMTNKGDAPVDVNVSAYINPKGRQINVGAYFTPRPGAYMEGYMNLGNSAPGGTLIIQFDYNTTREIVVE